MIKGKQSKEMYSIIKPDVNYRELKSLNASMIKLFDSDPVKFYEEFKLGKKRKDRKTSTSIIIGDLVDFYILECRGNHEEFENRFDEKFSLNTGAKGTGQNALLAEILYEITLDNTNDEGEVTAEFETMFKEAIVKIQAQRKFSGKDYDKILTEFNEKGYEIEVFHDLKKNKNKLANLKRGEPLMPGFYHQVRWMILVITIYT